MSNALKKITTRAKQIYAKGGTWKGAIKKAGAEYRGGKVTKKRATRKARAHKVRRKKVVGNVWPVAVGSVDRDEQSIQIAKTQLATLHQFIKNLQNAMKGTRGDRRKDLKQMITLRRAQVREVKTGLRLQIQQIRQRTKLKLKRIK